MSQLMLSHATTARGDYILKRIKIMVNGRQSAKKQTVLVRYIYTLIILHIIYEYIYIYMYYVYVCHQHHICYI